MFLIHDERAMAGAAPFDTPSVPGRARIEFNDDGTRQTLTREWRPRDTWLPLCDRIATKMG